MAREQGDVSEPPPTVQVTVLPTRAVEDEDRSWGEGPDSNERRLLEDVPPHWGGRAED